MKFLAVAKDGHILTQGEEIRTTRDNESWIFQSVTHPRKLYVTWDSDPKGPPYYPNRASREFYASVFDMGIWDVDHQEWSFPPHFDNPDIEESLREPAGSGIGRAELGESDILWSSDERFDWEDMYFLHEQYLSEKSEMTFEEWLAVTFRDEP